MKVIDTLLIVIVTILTCIVVLKGGDSIKDAK